MAAQPMPQQQFSEQPYWQEESHLDRDQEQQQDQLEQQLLFQQAVRQWGNPPHQYAPMRVAQPRMLSRPPPQVPAHPVFYPEYQPERAAHLPAGAAGMFQQWATARPAPDFTQGGPQYVQQPPVGDLTAEELEVLRQWRQHTANTQATRKDA